MHLHKKAHTLYSNHKHPELQLMKQKTIIRRLNPQKNLYSQRNTSGNNQAQRYRDLRIISIIEILPTETKIKLMTITSIKKQRWNIDELLKKKKKKSEKRRKGYYINHSFVCCCSDGLVRRFSIYTNKARRNGERVEM